MEETEVNLFSQTDIFGQMQAMMELQQGKTHERTINTRHMLFIVSGAFEKLSGVIERRIEASAIGFKHTLADGGKKNNEYIEQAEAQDFVQYGFEPEFIGRLPIRVPCESLEIEDLEQILVKSENSILEQYRNDFRGYNIEFDITEGAIVEVATEAYKEKTGARGLMTTLEQVFRDYKFELPSTSISSFEVTSKTITDPSKELKRLLKENCHAQQGILRREVDAYAHRFSKEHGLVLEFDEGAIQALVEMSLETDKTIRAICEDRFKDFQFGLKLLASKKGRKVFTVTQETVNDPDKELSRWVVENYPS